MTTRLCEFVDCGRKHASRGMCTTHYRMWLDGKPLRAIRPMSEVTDTTARDEHGRKRCARCGEWRTESEFYATKHTRDRLNSHCKPCMKWGNLLRNFGLTQSDFTRLLAAQGGGCAICLLHPEEDGRRFAVDHDRACCPTDKSCGQCIRGVLCPGCNTGIALLRDNVEILRAAIEYLEKAKTA